MKTHAPARLTSLFISVFFCAAALGADRTNPNLTVPGEPLDESAPSARSTPVVKSDKKWFVGFDTGFGTSKYSGTLKTEIDAYRNTHSAERSPTINLEGYFAWRLGTSRTILGPTLALAFESYDSTATSDLQAMNYFAGLMVEHFFDDEVKRGFFGRFDIGFAEVALTRTSTLDREFNGTGVRIGFGYSIPAGTRIGIPIMLQYQYASLGSSSEVSTLMLTGGMIF